MSTTARCMLVYRFLNMNNLSFLKRGKVTFCGMAETVKRQANFFV